MDPRDISEQARELMRKAEAAGLNVIVFQLQ